VFFVEQEEFDKILQVVENPVRRKMIKRLSQESCYALQLSKELGLGQPLVAKHLGVMEEAGLVSSTSEVSPSGPPRKKYSLAKGVSITMDVGPNVFIERGSAFGTRPKVKIPQVIIEFRRQLEQAKRTTGDRERLSSLAEVLRTVDKRIEEIESERAELVNIRNQTMREAAQIAGKVNGLEMRRVLFHILDEHDMGVESISETLNLREFSVKAILEELERDYFG
jgi:predicted transcriptional regulator